MGSYELDSKGVDIVNKLIVVLVAIIVIVLLVFAYIEIGKRTAHEGKAVVETTRGALDRARQSAEEMQKRIDQTKEELEKITGKEKK